MSNDKSDIQESQKNLRKRRASGEFVRGISKFRNKLDEDKRFPAEAGRYHLFVALNCPWCHRVTMARNILGLQNSISMDVVFPNRTDNNHPEGANLWEFSPNKKSSLTGKAFAECTKETATGKNFSLIKHIYTVEGSNEQSVPILYDKLRKCIVSNESADIIRMLNDYAGKLGSSLDEKIRPQLYPNRKGNSELCDSIDTLNEQIYININNGAYKAGFSSDQKVYIDAFKNYFDMLDKLNCLLAKSQNPFLTGDSFTESDLRLFPTIYRHDPIYYLRMKLNGAKILDYPSLWQWLCRVYALPGVASSSSLEHCKQGYFGRSWNNTIPQGPFKPMSYPQAYQHPELVAD